MALNRGAAGIQNRWDDERIPIGGMVLSGGNQPTVGVFIGTVSTLLFGAAGLNEVFLTIQIPHRYLEGSDIIPHVHYAPATAAAGDIRWGLEYAWENVGGQFSTPTDSIEITSTVPGVAGEQTIASFGSLVGTGKLISSMLCCRLYRDGADVLDTYGANAAMLEFDVHFQIDGWGSRQEFIK